MPNGVDHQIIPEKTAAMKKALGDAAQQLDDTLGEMKKIGKSMEDGALKGNAGPAFGDVINGKLLPAVQRLRDKLVEMEGDIVKAENEAGIAVERAARRFRN